MMDDIGSLSKGYSELENKSYGVVGALGIGIVFLIMTLILMGMTIYIYGCLGANYFHKAVWYTIISGISFGCLFSFVFLRVSREEVCVDGEGISWNPGSEKSRRIKWRDLRSVREGEYLLTNLKLRDDRVEIKVSSMLPVELKEIICRKYSEVFTLPPLPVDFHRGFHGVGAFLFLILVPSLGAILCSYPLWHINQSSISDILFCGFTMVFMLYLILKNFQEIKKIIVTENSLVLISGFGNKEVKFSELRYLSLGESREWNSTFWVPILLTVEGDKTFILGRRIGDIPYLYAFLRRLMKERCGLSLG